MSASLRGILPFCTEAKKTSKQLLVDKAEEVSQTLADIENGLESMNDATKANVELVQKEFEDLVNKIQQRRDALIKSLNEIAFDKQQILKQQASDLKTYKKQITAESEKSESEIDVKLAQQKVSIATRPEILINVNNEKLSDMIASMGDVNNTFPPNPPKIKIEEIKAHTCKVFLSEGSAKYDGFQKMTGICVEIAFAPKIKIDEDKIDFSTLKWKKIAKRDECSPVSIKKMKPATTYFVRATCQNEYGWSNFCKPVSVRTLALKFDTKIMNSDEIEILIDLVKEKREKQSVEWKLLFRGSDNGFLAATFHQNCDNMANTICVIESDHGNVFGGFTTLPWKSDVGRYRVDEEAFVYIVRQKKKSLKKALMYLQYDSSQHSVVHNKYMGPVFGYGHDIYIRNKADKVDDNSCRNHTYKCSYAGELAGKEKFRVINYEVFQISHPEDDIQEQSESDIDDGDSDDDDDDDEDEVILM